MPGNVGPRAVRAAVSDIYLRLYSVVEEIAQEEKRIQILKKKKAALVSRVLRDIDQSESGKQRVSSLKRISSLLHLDEMTEQAARLFSQSNVPLYDGASFKRSLLQCTRRRQLSRYSPSWELNNQRKAYDFVDNLGVRRPSIYQEKTRLERLDVRPGMVLKPENGSSSQGVYILGEKEVSYEVKTGKYFYSHSELFGKIKTILKEKTVKKDSWFLEEFIGDFQEGVCRPARDLKFYCFFGEVGFVLEVDRSESARYCDWLPDGTQANTGLPNNRFVGDGFSSSEVGMAAHVSRHIHSPFMRIDFLKWGDELVFGEFTPRPGQFHSFNKEFDRYLGELYLNAEARLLEHLSS